MDIDKEIRYYNYTESFGWWVPILVSLVLAMITMLYAPNMYWIKVTEGFFPTLTSVAIFSVIIGVGEVGLQLGLYYWKKRLRRIGVNFNQMILNSYYIPT